MQRVNLLDMVFGDLIVIQELGSDRRGKKLWLCRCKCGNTSQVLGSNLKTGHTKSCGCQKNNHSNLRHGKYGTSVYGVWHGMIQRCNNVNHIHYNKYGGRGITVCEEWLKFENFYKDMGDRPDDFTLERVDNNKGYSKGNCKWASKKEQARNRKSSKSVMYKGVIQTIAAWEECFGFKHGTLWHRLYVYNWSIEKAFETLSVFQSSRNVVCE